MTAVSSTSATTPVARLAYQNTVEELIPLTCSASAANPSVGSGGALRRL